MIINSGHVLSARFVLVRPLGQGATGAVWLAQDRQLGGYVALKLLKPELTGNAGVVAALERECERLQSLAHPNIIRVDGLYRDQGQVWIAMEYLAGGDLTRYRGRPQLEVLPVVLPVAEALTATHAAGIVHRDVKTTNVLLSLDGSPRLADFGLALAFTEAIDPGPGGGSPYSMSPQQLAGAPAQTADDVYAFGVLLHELLSGYPPFYPDFDPQQVMHQSPPALAPRFPVTDSLMTLVQQCLAKEPQHRPDMATVVRQLRSAREQERRPDPMPVLPPVLRPPAASEVPLTAGWQRSTPAQAGPTSAELRSEGFRRGLTVAALALLLAAAGAVFFVLPQRVAPPMTAAAPPTAPATPAPTSPTPTDLEALAVLKAEADDRLAAISPRVEALRPRAVEQWAGDSWAALQAALTAAGTRYSAGDYAAARTAYETAAKDLDILEARADEVLKDSLTRGGTALADGNAVAATAAFELALKLSPGQSEAIRGLRRAQLLEQVMSLVNQAEVAEKEGKLSIASEAFSRAVGLDPETGRATAGLARVQARVAGDAFAAAMAGVFTALSQKDYAVARKALDRARGLRPQAPEVQQALQQLEQEERTVAIAARLASARNHESAERWGQALADYRAALELDATVAAAQQGVDRSTPRAALNDELQLYVTQPERLFSPSVRNAATVALGRAKSVATAGPVLTQQVATLEQWLARVSMPVQVALESDNQTQVTIYRVGDLGAFTRRAVDLVPGRYTVVGTRPGFRDVRQEITVLPGAAPAPIVIRCEDQI